MASHKDDPVYWRKRAKELRELADHISHLGDKAEILEMVQSYERVAQRIEFIKRTPNSN